MGDARSKITMAALTLSSSRAPGVCRTAVVSLPRFPLGASTGSGSTITTPSRDVRVIEIRASHVHNGEVHPTRRAEALSTGRCTDTMIASACLSEVA